VTAPTARRALPDGDASRAALLLAVDPHGLGGVVVKGGPGPERDGFLAELARLLPSGSPCTRIPVNVGFDRLIGGLDFGATMASGRPVHARGLLEASDGGVAIVSMAERLPPAVSAVLSGTVDTGKAVIERDGLGSTKLARFAVVALDEGLDDEALDEALADRLAFTLRIGEHPSSDIAAPGWSAEAVLDARQRLRQISVDDDALELLCRTAAAFGIDSPRALILAVRAAKAAAALAGDSRAGETAISMAAQLVFPQRALAVPADPEEAEEPQTPSPQSTDETAPAREGDLPEDVIVDAVRARVPDGLLELLQSGRTRRQRNSGGSRGGPKKRGQRRGRPVAATRGEIGDGHRLNLLATLKAAAPWQRLRRENRLGPRRPLEIRKDDIHVHRYEDRAETTTIFAVDASGSQAAQRLAEVKGAIELLLNDCYVRRDQVALIAFRGNTADSLLPPTRALARVKRSLRALPGGGGTPLAAGLDAARRMALAELGQGRNAVIVLMTDGRANISLAGEPVPADAEADALASGRAIAMDGIRSLLVDTSRRPKPRARRLAEVMQASYVPLPQADAQTISNVVQMSVA